MEILLIEDDQYIIEDILFYLEESGIKCKVYKSTDTIIRNIDTFGNYKYIILDIMLKRGESYADEDLELETGEILFRIIREKFPLSKFIIMSAKQFSDMKIDFSKEENVQIIKKPINTQIIQNMINIIKMG